MSGRPDIAWSKHVASISIGQLLLWSSAAVLAMAAHAGAVWWIMQAPPSPAVDLGAPVAIIINLAPVPMVPASDEKEASSDTVDSAAAEEMRVPDEVEPVETVEQVEPEPEVAEKEEPVEAEKVAPEPIPEVETADAVEPDVELPDVAQVPLPTPRPTPKPKVAEKPREPEKPKQVVKQQAPAPSREARAAKVQARQEAPRAAAPQSNRGAPSMSSQKWQSRLLAHLERRKRYPASAKRKRLEGTAQVRFTIDDSGNVQSVALAGSSGIPELDEEVVAMVRRASPVPPPPPGVDRTIVVPVQFDMR